MSDDQNNQAQPDAANEFAAKLQEAEAKRDEYLNGWKRAQADFVNYKKDEAKRFDEAAGYASVRMVRELLPVLDSVGFALATFKKDDPAVKGVALIQSQFLEILKRLGVEKIAVAKGDMFDPSKHEAMMEVDAPPDSENLSGKILEELVAGYEMEGRVIRAAKVKLVK